MLLKYSQIEKKSKINGKQQRGTGNMKLIVGNSTLGSRLPRKTVKGFGTKRPASHMRSLPVSGKDEHRTPVDACDNSNDSGLGFDQHLDVSVQAALRFTERESIWNNEHPEAKRKKLEIKLESDDANDNFSFSQAMNRSHKATLQSGGLVPECLMPSRGSATGAGVQRPLGGSANNGNHGGGGGGNTQRSTPIRPPPRSSPLVARRPAGPVPLSSQLMGFSRDGKVQLQIASQPEQQHRARYQTEGSRGAVKDRSGNSFPVVKLVGYNKPATLQVFIGTDMGRVAPHMFYQACKVSGKNSTPCVEKKIAGTIVIEVNFDPAKDMTITCDCVGILKERNVDVEHRFPDQTGARNKKKSTRCRMVFRTTISHPDGSTEILQATSQPIVCTQPPGVPEICKKSLCACPCSGGMELFILGKNFLKDTRVVFQQNDIDPVWEETVQPDKEFLQQTHLVCAVPAYQRCDILEPVTVRLLVTSSGKTSEPHTFTYMPVTNPVLQAAVGTPDIPQSCLALVSPGITPDLNRPFSKPPLGHPAGLILPGAVPAKVSPPILPNLVNQFLPVDSTPVLQKKDIRPPRHWTSTNLGAEPLKPEDTKVREEEQNKVLGLKMMPPPPPLLPICAHRSSSNVLIIPDPLPVTEMKTEIIDESSQESTQLSPEELKGIDLRMKPGTNVVPMATVSDLLSTQSPSLATLRRFVSNPGDAPLPTQSVQSVEKYLSRIENPTTVKSTGETVVTAVVPTATVVTRTADSSSQELTLTKLHSTEKPINSQFNAPLIFGASQAVGANILSGNLQPPATEPSEKVPFVSEMPMRNIYNSSSIVKKEQQKSQLLEQNTLSSTITSRILAGLNSVAPGKQSKAEYQEASIANLCSSQSSASSLLPSVAESTLPNFHASSVSNTAEPSSLNGPSLLTSIAENASIMETSPLIFNHNSQQASSKALLPSTTNPQKSDDQLIDNSNKHANPTSSVAVLGNTHNLTILPTTVAPPSSTSLNIPSSANAMSGNLLSVPETDQSLMNVTSGTRLDVLVSSAIENHILEANRQKQSTEKLGVFSAAGNLINNMSSEGSVLNSQQQVPLNDELSSGQNNTSTSVHVQDMSLNSTIASVSPVNTFTFNSLTSVPPISQENLILSNTVPASYTEHILASSAAVKNSEVLVLNSVNETALTMDTPISSTNSSALVLNSPPRTSPIAIKNIILESTGANENMIAAVSTQNLPVSGKNIINSPPLTSADIHISGHSCTSPIAMKTMILNATSEVEKPQGLSSSLNVKDILSQTAMNPNISLASSASHCTTPIAMKKIILESTIGGEVLHNPPQPSIAVKSVLNSQTTPDISLISETVPVVSLSTEKLDALVESTISNHMLASTPAQSTVNSNMNLETTCTATNSLPLATQSLATILVSNMTSDLTNSSSLLSQSSNLVSEEQREIHNSSDITLGNHSSGSTTSQSQPGGALLTIFPNDGNSISKNPSLPTNSIVPTPCPVLDNHLSGIFVGQQSTSVHSLHPPNQTAAVNSSEVLQHTPTFTSANAVTQGLLANTSLANKLDVTEGQPQSGLYNQVLMNLGVTDSRKSAVDTNLNAEKRETEDNSKYLVTNVSRKIAERNGVEASNSVAITELNVVQAVHALQHESQEQKGLIKQKELAAPSSLPVPAPEISSNTQNKETVPIVQGPPQKKLEEGMVPQELTQMSESDLLSYINPSCFDQV